MASSKNEYFQSVTFDELRVGDLIRKANSESPEASFMAPSDQQVAAMDAAVLNRYMMEGTPYETPSLEEFFISKKFELEQTPNRTPSKSIDEEIERYKYHIVDESITDFAEVEQEEITPELQPIVDHKAEFLKGIEASLSDDDRREVALITAATRSGFEVESNALERIYYWRKVKEIIDQADWKDYATLLAPDYTLDINQLMESGLLDIDNAGFAMGREWADFVNKFNFLPQEERLLLFNRMVEDIQDVYDDNELKAGMRLIEMIDPYGVDVKFENLIEAADVTAVADVALLAPILLKTLTRLSRVGQKSNIVNRLKEAGLVDDAGRVNAQSIINPQAGDETGISTATAVDNAMPFDMTILNPAASSGTDVANATQDTLTDIQRATRKYQESVESTIESIHSTSLTADRIIDQQEFDSVVAKEIKDMQDYLDATYDAQGWKVTKPIEVMYDPSTGGYKMTAEVEGAPISRPINVTFNTLGKLEFNADEVNRLALAIASPTAKFKRLDSRMVSSATEGGFQEDALRISLEQQYIKALEGVSTKSIPLIDGILLESDEFVNPNGVIGKVFTPSELAARGLTDTKDQIGYYRTIQFGDLLYRLKNGQTRNTMILQGKKEVVVNGSPYIGKPSVSFQGLDKSVTRDLDNGVVKVWFDGARGGKGGFVKSTNIHVGGQRMSVREALKTGQYVLARFSKPQNFKGKEWSEYALVETGKINPLPLQVIHKRPMYIPKLNQDVFYVAKVEVPSGTAHGSPHTVTKTLRFFDSKEEGQRFIDDLRDRSSPNYRIDPLTGKQFDTGTVVLDLLQSGKMLATDIDDAVVQAFGGLYTQPRAKSDILFGIDGSPTKRAGAYESLDRYMSNVATHTPLNEWRLIHQQKFIGTYGKYLERPNDFDSPVRSDAVLTPRQRATLEDVRNYIRLVTRMPTKKEQDWENFVYSLYETLERGGGLGKKVGRALMRNRHMDLPAAIRTAVFHGSLGMGNPVQLWVQAQQASVALAVDPIAWPKNMQRYLSTRVAIFNPDNPELVKAAALATGQNPTEFKKFLDAFHKSGLSQGLYTSADYANVVGGGLSDQKTLKRVFRAGLLPFREGELFTRLYSWSAAYNRWRKIKGNSARELDGRAIEEITERALNKMFNLNRSNAANWQHGWMSLPTQFFQITAKTVENLLPNWGPLRDFATGKFTNFEKSRIMLFQWLLYGSAGVPMAQGIRNGLAKYLGYDTVEAAMDHPVAFELMEDGFWEQATQMVFGAEVELGERGSLISGATQTAEFLLETFLGEQPPPITGALPFAFLGIGSRAMEAISAISPLVNPANILNSWTGETDEDGYQITMNELKIAAVELGDLIPSLNNVHQALIWEDIGAIKDSQGRNIMQYDEPFWREYIGARMIGFQPQKVADYYNLGAAKGAMLKKDRATMKVLQKLYGQYADLLERDEVDEKTMANFVIKAGLIIRNHSPGNELHQKEFMIKFYKTITDPDDAYGKRLRDALESYLMYDRTGTLTTGTRDQIRRELVE